MTSQTVNLTVTATIPIDYDFWSEDDGWTGCCKSPSVMVNGRSVEDAKRTWQLNCNRVSKEFWAQHAKCVATGVSLMAQTLKAQPGIPPVFASGANARDAVGVGPRG
jgi:hypothetical protein